MFTSDDYRLIDFGAGYKLESLGGVRVLRQTPSAGGFGPSRKHWPEAAAVFEKSNSKQATDKGIWRGQSPKAWQLSLRGTPVELSLRQTPSGQIGVFPEQAENWQWFIDRRDSLKGIRGINLFAYTGGSTLVLADCGVAMTHVDSARSVVSWARDNANQSGMQSAPIRWIVEDAVKYAGRESKRGNQYEVLVADPPSFGRGPSGQVWKLQRDLPELLDLLASLASPDLQAILISCHTPGVGAMDLHRFCDAAFSGLPQFAQGVAESLELSLVAEDGPPTAVGCLFSLVTRYVLRHRKASLTQLISSLQNPRVKAAMRLHSSRGRKQQGRMIIFGIREIRRAIAAGLDVDELFLSDEEDPMHWSAVPESQQFHCNDEVLAKLQYGDRAEGVVATAARPKTTLGNFKLQGSDQGRLLLVLERLEKPGNLGAILRSADATGVHGVLVADPLTDPFHPNAIRASTGVVFSTPLAMDDNRSVRSWLIENNFNIFSACLQNARDFFSCDLRGDTAIVLGNEASGLSEHWRTEAIQAVKLPMLGTADSLNVSVTASVMLFEALRQRSRT